MKYAKIINACLFKNVLERQDMRYFGSHDLYIHFNCFPDISKTLVIKESLNVVNACHQTIGRK